MGRQAPSPLGHLPSPLVLMEIHSTYFLRLHSTNEAPTTMEAATIQQERDAITSQIRALETHLRRYQAILNPLRRIPTEVLGEIFKVVVGEGSTSAQKAQILALCLVCKAWRDAAYLTHSLWGKLTIELSPNLSHEAVKRWISRAPRHSRELTVVESSADECVQGPGAAGASVHPRHHVEPACQWRSKELGELLTNGPPLHSLHLTMSSSLCLLEILSTMDSLSAEGQVVAFHSIKSLSLIWGHEALWRASPELPHMLYSRLPALSALHTSLPHDDHVRRDIVPALDPPQPPCIHIPPTSLGRLTSLTIKCNWDSPSTMLALEHCANLEALSLDFEGFTTFWSQDAESAIVIRLLQSRVYLPKLHTLKALNMYSPHAALYMPFLLLPKLDHLHASFSAYDNVESEDSEDTGESFMAFVDSISVGHPRFKEQIRTLEIARDTYIEGMKASDLSTILTSFPSLRHFTLDHLNFNPFELGDDICNSTMLLPELECLRLLNIPGEFDLGGMLTFLLACRRLGGISKLHILDIGYAKPLYMRSKVPEDASTDIDSSLSIAQSLASLGVQLQGRIWTMDGGHRLDLARP